MAVSGIVSGAVVLAQSDDAQSDRVSATEYLHAGYSLQLADQAALPMVRAAVDRYAAGVVRQCPAVIVGARRPPTGAGTSPEGGLSQEVLDAVALLASRSIGQAEIKRDRAAAEVIQRTRWKDSDLTHLRRLARNEERAWATLAEPNLCEDLKAWAQVGFKALPGSTASFLRRWHAIEQQASAGLFGRNVQVIHATPINKLIVERLRRYEDAGDRSLAEHVEALEAKVGPTLAKIVLRAASQTWKGLGFDR